MTTIRQQRVSELLFEELSIIIANELDDRDVSLVQVSSVSVSRDLRNVKVFVSHDDADVSKQNVLRGLKRATPYLRRQIAARCGLRAVPDLIFHYDDRPEKAARVDELLRQIASENTSSSMAANDGTQLDLDHSSDHGARN